MLHRCLASCLIAISLAVAALLPTPSKACGGFFCNALTQVPVYQQGERVLFAQHDALVTMHIEVIYGGDDPSKFAWLLPVPDVPKGIDGEPLPLDRAVSVSIPELFDELQARTNPSFTLTRTAHESYEGCLMTRTTAGGFASADSGMESSPQDDGAPTSAPVTVLQQAAVGPYDAQLIAADSSQALFTWLNDNGYYQDPAAQPLLGYYVSQGYKFIGIRLQADKQTDDLKPLALRLGENAPCVPLRLTGIAASPDMPILVWVAGHGRAVPKNFVHAEINPMAIAMPSASNYVDTVTAAMDLSVGRAWVTEFSGSNERFRNMYPMAPGLKEEIESVTNVQDLFAAAGGFLSMFSHFQDVVRDEVPLPDGLRGYPYGECWYAEDPASPCEENADHVTTEAEFYPYLSWWLMESNASVGIVANDIEGLKQRVLTEIVEPAQGVNEIFDKTTTLTRFFTTIDPENMTKDPIFAFNDSLPPVEQNHTVNTVVYGSGPDTCGPGAVVATYDDGSSFTWTCDGESCWDQALQVDAVEGASPLKNLEVLDETGAAMPFDPAQAEEVDAMLDGAVVGQPSLTDQERESLLPPPPIALPPGATAPGVPPSIPDLVSKDDDSGCVATESSNHSWLLLALFLLAVVRSRHDRRRIFTSTPRRL